MEIFPFCKAVYQPAVNGAAGNLPCFGQFFYPFHILENPGQLGRGKIGRELQSRPGLDSGSVSGPLNLLADGGASGALPYNGVVNRLPCLFVPAGSRLPLIADAQHRQLRFVNPRLLHQILHHLHGICVNLIQIMFHPAPLVDDLPVGQVASADQFSGRIKKQRLRSLGALINSQYISFHLFAPVL